LQQCVLASGNAGKLAELSAALADFNLQLISQSEFNYEEAEENAVTFVENALIKARHASAETGLPALADDSGLVVHSLNGEPGIYSARYAGSTDGSKPTDAENITRLLSRLGDTEDRSAHFVCVLALVKHRDDPEPLIATGRWHGSILSSPQGDSGFGYDPVFFCPRTGMSAAAMGKEKKSAISHRALAVQQLRELLGE
jgi:XTP/dITP diphosphohydrolase